MNDRVVEVAPGLGLRRLGAPDAAAWQTLRLTAMRAHPIVYGVSLEEQGVKSLDEVAAGLASTRMTDISLGVFAGADLVGGASFWALQGERFRHRGTIGGVFVRESVRRRGLAEALSQALLAHASAHVDVVHVSVLVGNEAARNLYLKLGFVPFAFEPRGLKIDGSYHGEEQLRLEIARGDEATLQGSK